MERHQPQAPKKTYGKVDKADHERPEGEARSLEETPATSDDNLEEGEGEKTRMQGRFGKAPATMPKYSTNETAEHQQPRGEANGRQKHQPPATTQAEERDGEMKYQIQGEVRRSTSHNSRCYEW